MKRNLNFAFILGLLILALAACKKDVPREELLTTGSWKGESALATVLGVTFDLNDSLPACALDDLTRFKTDKNLEIDEGPTKCDPSDPQTYIAGTWSLSENDSKLAFGGTTYDIQELTENRLRLSGPFGGLGITGTIQVTYVK